MSRRTIIGAVAVVTLIATGWGLYALGEKQGTRTAALSVSTGDASNEAALVAAPEPEAGKKILYYHDPMVPGTKFDKPGKSPFMDMQLVPVYEKAVPLAAPTMPVASPSIRGPSRTSASVPPRW